jgi:hypothetical protein
MSTIGPSPFLCGFALALYDAHRAGLDDRSIDKAMKAAQITVADLRAAGVNERDVREIERCVRPELVTLDPTKPPWGDGDPHPYLPPWCTCKNSLCDGDGGMEDCEYSTKDHDRYNDACAAWDAAYPAGKPRGPVPDDHPVMLAIKNAPMGPPLSEEEQRLEDAAMASIAAGVRLVPHAEVMAALALRVATEHCGCPYHAARKAEQGSGA